MQIKTSLRFCLTPVRMAALKKTKDNKDQQVCGERQTLTHFGGVVKHYKTGVVISQKEILK